MIIIIVKKNCVKDFCNKDNTIKNKKQSTSKAREMKENKLFFF